jgi:hypothetical protein
MPEHPPLVKPDLRQAGVLWVFQLGTSALPLMKLLSVVYSYRSKIVRGIQLVMVIRVNLSRCPAVFSPVVNFGCLCMQEITFNWVC